MPAKRQQKRRVRIMIADHEAVFRFGLMKLLGLEEDMRVVAQAEQGEHLLTLAKTFHPDVVFVQAEILSAEAGNFLARISQVLPRSKSIVLVTTLSEDESMRYIKAGAAGVILKSAEPPLFVKCVRRVMAGELWLPKQHVARMAKTLGEPALTARRPAETLTPRERSIVSHLMAGYRNREVGRMLSISEQTVKNHLRAIYDKLGVSDRLELVLYVIHRRLELPPLPDLTTNNPGSAEN
jgi:DNA-binding NarL/FixJ family response regulator